MDSEEKEARPGQVEHASLDTEWQERDDDDLSEGEAHSDGDALSIADVWLTLQHEAENAEPATKRTRKRAPLAPGDLAVAPNAKINKAILQWVLTRAPRNLDPLERDILLNLIGRCDTAWDCKPSAARIATDLLLSSKSERRVRAALTRLVAKKILTKSYRQGQTAICRLSPTAIVLLAGDEMQRELSKPKFALFMARTPAVDSRGEAAPDDDEPRL